MDNPIARVVMGALAGIKSASSEDATSIQHALARLRGEGHHEPVAIGQFEFEGQTLIIYRGTYSVFPGCIAIFLESAIGERWATVSEYHALASPGLGLDEFVVQSRNISEGLLDGLLGSGYFEAVGRRYSFGHGCNEPIWRLIREDK